MDRQIILSEALGITTSLGSLLRVLAFFIAATIGYITLRNDLSAAVEQGKRNEFTINETRQTLDHTRMDVNTIGTKFDEFMRSYDRDMNRYIRTDKDRR